MGVAVQIAQSRELARQNAALQARINAAAASGEAAAQRARQDADRKIAELTAKYEEQLARDRTFTSLAEQIRALGGGTTAQTAIGGAGGLAIRDAIASLGSQRNFGASDLASRMNFQVSDQQILDDYNNTKLVRLNNIISQGNTQIAGIQERLNSANALLAQLPSGDPRRTSSEVYVNQLRSDLSSVQSAVTEADSMVKNFKPLTVADEAGKKEITSFRDLS